MKGKDIFKVLAILLLFFIVQQLMGGIIGVFYYLLTSGAIQQLLDDPTLGQDVEWIMQQASSPDMAMANVGIGLSLSSLAFIVVMVLSRLARPGFHRTTPQSIVWALLLIVPMSIVSNVAVEATHIEDMMGDIVERAMHTTWGVISIALLGPIAEEVCFRAGIFGLFIAKARETGNPRLISIGLMVQALFFAGLHVNPVQVIFAFLLGILIGWVYLRTGSIWPCIAMHVANNSMAVVMTHLFPSTQTMTELFGGTTITVCICLLCVWSIWTLLTRLQYVAPDD